MSDTDKDKLEVVSGDDVRYQRSEFASVVFHGVADTYPADAHVECSYTLTVDIEPTRRDYVGVYKVGWMSPRNYIYYEWAPSPKNYEAGKESEATILFQAHTLPNDDGEFYQFCYVSSAGQIRGASTPFQFKKPSADDFVEVEDENTDMLIIKSRTVYLKENLQKKENENRDLIKYRDTMAKEVTSLADKITDLEKRLHKSERERRDVQKLLSANQTKLDEMLSDANDMTLVHDELRSKVDEKEKDKITLEEKLTRLHDRMGSLQAKLKVLLSEKDELEGKNRATHEEMDLYKGHLSKSECSTSVYVKEIEMLTSHLDTSSKTIGELSGKLEDQDVTLSQCREEINRLRVEIHCQKVKVDEQVHVTQSEKENVVVLAEKLHNAEDKLATEENTKDLMLQELHNLKAAHDKISQDLTLSKSECHMMKTQIGRMEEDFAQENALLQSENLAVEDHLRRVLQEKEVLEAQLCSQQEEMAKIQGTVDGAEGPMFALHQANTGLKRRLTHLNERYGKVIEEKKQGRLRERDLCREIVDLKERISMCSEEYKQLYKDNRKLQKKVDKMAGHKLSRDGKSESEKSSLSPKKTPERHLAGTDGPMITDVAELQTQLAVQKSKKDKYKQMYREEKERLETLRRHYHDDLQVKDAEISRLKKSTVARGAGSCKADRSQKIRTLEKYLDDKEKMISELNQKLRACKFECETPKPAKRTTLPVKSDGEAAAHSPTLPNLMYGNPYLEESKLLSQGATAAAPTPTTTEPIYHAPAVTSPPLSQQMARSEEPEDVFVDASPHLPKPLEPEVTSEARLAAVMASLPQDNPGGDTDELKGTWYGMPVNRTGIHPSAPTFPILNSSDPDDIVVKVNSGRWLINANGEKRKCPRCSDEFPSEMKEEDFLEHVLGHLGRICPVCKMQVDDSVHAEDFEYHVHCCIGDSNNN